VKLGLKDRTLVVDRFIPNEEVPPYFQAADTIVLFYETATPSGVESLSYNFKLPAVATRVGHFPETITDGFNGYMAEPKNIADMVRVMNASQHRKAHPARERGGGHEEHELGELCEGIENINSGVMERTIYNYPLSRYEYYADNTHFRRIEIDQRTDRVDTLMTEDLETGELEIIVRPDLVDIPKGAYLEFFPNGNIRILGTLDGYSPDGKLKKTGEWKEWDADGKVIRQETYP
jgi:hypothetical protein